MRAYAESDWCGAQTSAIAVPYTNHEHPPDLSTGIPALCHSAACRLFRCGNAICISICVRPSVRVLFIAVSFFLRLCLPHSACFVIQGGPRLAANWPRLMVAFHGRGALPAAPAGALGRRGGGVPPSGSRSRAKAVIPSVGAQRRATIKTNIPSCWRRSSASTSQAKSPASWTRSPW